ncbi:MAG: hypothetical protein KIT14_02715 [bacterium]|nr:hypothetical protein [bacterium]
MVTFLLTDVEGSTALWRQGAHAATQLARQAELLAAAVARHGGVRPLEQGEGDSLVAVFDRPSAALAAALEGQRLLAAEAWPDATPLRVRMALHSGEAVARDDGTYGGTSIIRAARLRDLARGGQVLVSGAAAALAREHLPEGATLATCERVILAGFDDEEQVHQLCHPALETALGPLRRPPGGALTAWPTPLIGRTRERAELTALLAEARLLTVTGAGGSGKTRLAHAVAAERAGEWPDGVTWVELARVADGAQVAGAIAAECSLGVVPGMAPLEVLRRALAAHRRLVVLDNCEHVLPACAEVADALLRAAPGVTLLATSREPLGVSGEVTWRIPSLDLPPDAARAPQELLAFDATQLFVERARAAQPDFVLDAGSAAAVARICRRLDGIPLALELAAARLRALPAERLADALDDRFRLLTGGARTALARQRTLLASVEWSHALLDEDERVLFRRLGVFAAPFELEAAEAVTTGDDLDPYGTLDLLGRLVDKSLVQPADGRFRLLETLRQFALERAADADELVELRDRHLAWMRRRAARWDLEREVATRAILAEVSREMPDVLQALEWSLAPDRAPAIELLRAVEEYGDDTGNLGNVRAVAARVLPRFAEGSAAWLDALAPIAVGLFFSGDVHWMPAAQAALEREGARLRPERRTRLAGALGNAALYRGRPEALAAMRAAIEDARQTGTRAAELEATTNLAVHLAVIGAHVEVRPLVAWLDRHMPADARRHRTVDAVHALTALYGGEFAAARRIVMPSPGMAGDHVGASIGALLAMWTTDAGLLAWAEREIDRFTDGLFVGLRHQIRGLIPLLAGEPAAAIAHLEAAKHAPSLANHVLWAQMLLAEVHLALDGPDEAAEIVAHIAAQIEGGELPLIAVETGLCAAEIARRRGEPMRAETHAHAALARAAGNDLRLAAIDALETLVVLAADAGDAALAGRLLGTCDEFRRRAGYRWVPLHRHRTLEALRPGLEPMHLAEGAALPLADAIEYAQRGRGERGRPALGWESLTPSERRVVELIAAGLPNKAIAAKLFVSVATVKTHLLHVFGKLGMRTRAELAGAAIRRAGERE